MLLQFPLIDNWPLNSELAMQNAIGNTEHTVVNRREIRTHAFPNMIVISSEMDQCFQM